MPTPDDNRRRVLAAAALTACGVAGTSGCAAPAALRAAADSRISRWKEPRFGFNVGVLDVTRHDDAFFAAAAGYGARMVRMFVPMGGLKARARLDYIVRQDLGKVLSRVERAGLSMVLVPELDAETTSPLWSETAHAEAFANTWAALARTCRGAEVMAGFDLLNEPNPPWPDGKIGSGNALWSALARRALDAIRVEDPEVPVLLEGVAGGNAMGLQALGRWDDPALVYSIHFYMPHEITHQKVSPRWPRTLAYPNHDPKSLEGTWAHPGPWDIARLRSELLAAAQRARADDMPVYVGEFGCVRWAPGLSAAHYISDCMALFKEFNWSWTYHEFRGWPGWDAETTGPDLSRQPRSSDAPVILRLREAMSRQKS